LTGGAFVAVVALQSVMHDGNVVELDS